MANYWITGEQADYILKLNFRRLQTQAKELGFGEAFDDCYGYMPGDEIPYSVAHCRFEFPKNPDHGGQFDEDLKGFLQQTKAIIGLQYDMEFSDEENAYFKALERMVETGAEEFTQLAEEYQ